MKPIFNKIPTSLIEFPQWVLWRYVDRDGEPTKVPFTVDGKPAKANDPSTWTTFDNVQSAYREDYHAGVGFEFSADDSFVGIDLDGCRDEDGEITNWAKQIILNLNSYAEVSPSERGVKVFVKGELQGGGRKILIDADPVCEKAPGLEIYSVGRYFAVTGHRLKGAKEPCYRQTQLDELIARYWPSSGSATQSAKDFYSPDAVLDRARKYLAKLPAAISGQRGHDAAFRVACVLVLGFGLGEGDATTLFAEWNQTCRPPWSGNEIAHKIKDAGKQPGERNYLRNVQPANWSSVKLPDHTSPSKTEVRRTSLGDAARAYLKKLREGKTRLIETGISDLDHAVAGGFEHGEMVLLAARPSHGKSLCAMQFVHNWTRAGMKSIVISQEMSALALGKRALQHMTDLHEEHWNTSPEELDESLRLYEQTHESCTIVESCGTAEVAAEEIRKAAKAGVECAIVDYIQLLRSTGKSRYEEVSKTSMLLRQVANETGVLLVALSQLNRAIEGRKEFIPTMADIRDTGQLEQDADVVIFCVWPHRIDRKRDAREYLFFIAKNRNRAINQSAVGCRLRVSRQMIEDAKQCDAWSEDQQYDERQYKE